MTNGHLAAVRVLVVDDDPDINRLLQFRLSKLGCHVESAPSGEEGLARLAVSLPDVLFLDVSMPGISGLDVLDRVRVQKLDIAVVMVTAFGSEKVAIEALRRGADDYLRKPFEGGEFQAVVQRTVSRLQLSRQNAELRLQLQAKCDQLETELARAATVQAGLLPREVPEVPGFELAGQCVPAREVGGDFYDWHQRDSTSLALTVGDVMGKGMPAALLMATARATLRAVAHQNTPAVALQLAEYALQVDLESSGSFITLFHAHLDAPARRLSYVDAGHGYVFLLRANGAVEPLEHRGVPLGVAAGKKREEGEVRLDAGDSLVVYTDGLAEGGSDLSRDQGVLAARLAGANSASEMVGRLIGQTLPARAHTDDMTVVVLHCIGR